MDGGAHDNQGVEALLDRGCNHLIVSDASAQMGDEPRPVPRLPSELARIQSIYGDRVREGQLGEALAHPPVAFVHLQKRLGARVLYPRRRHGSTPPPRPVDPSGPGTASFGVDEHVQRLLARVRTDLDAFSTIESKSLMYGGYAIARSVLEGPDAESTRALTPWPPAEQPWPFQTIAAAIARRPEGRYRTQLEAASERFLKPLYLRRPWVAPSLVVLAAVAAAGFGAWRLWESAPAVSGFWATIVFLAVLAAAVMYVKPGLPVLGWIGFVLYELAAPLALGLASLVAWPLTYPAGRLARALFLWRGREPNGSRRRRWR